MATAVCQIKIGKDDIGAMLTDQPETGIAILSGEDRIAESIEKQTEHGQRGRFIVNDQKYRRSNGFPDGLMDLNAMLDPRTSTNAKSCWCWKTRRNHLPMIKAHVFS